MGSSAMEVDQDLESHGSSASQTPAGLTSIVTRSWRWLRGTPAPQQASQASDQQRSADAEQARSGKRRSLLGKPEASDVEANAGKSGGSRPARQIPERSHGASHSRATPKQPPSTTSTRHRSMSKMSESGRSSVDHGGQTAAYRRRTSHSTLQLNRSPPPLTSGRDRTAEYDSSYSLSQRQVPRSQTYTNGLASRALTSKAFAHQDKQSTPRANGMLRSPSPDRMSMVSGASASSRFGATRLPHTSSMTYGLSSASPFEPLASDTSRTSYAMPASRSLATGLAIAGTLSPSLLGKRERSVDVTLSTASHRSLPRSYTSDNRLTRRQDSRSSFTPSVRVQPFRSPSPTSHTKKKQAVWDPSKRMFVSADDMRRERQERQESASVNVPRNEAERILSVLESMRTPLAGARQAKPFTAVNVPLPSALPADKPFMTASMHRAANTSHISSAVSPYARRHQRELIDRRPGIASRMRDANTQKAAPAVSAPHKDSHMNDLTSSEDEPEPQPRRSPRKRTQASPKPAPSTRKSRKTKESSILPTSESDAPAPAKAAKAAKSRRKGKAKEAIAEEPDSPAASSQTAEPETSKPVQFARGSDSLRPGRTHSSRTHASAALSRFSAREEDLPPAEAEDLEKIKLPPMTFPQSFAFSTTPSVPVASKSSSQDQPVESGIPSTSTSAAKLPAPESKIPASPFKGFSGLPAVPTPERSALKTLRPAKPAQQPLAPAPTSVVPLSIPKSLGTSTPLFGAQASASLPKAASAAPAIAESTPKPSTQRSNPFAAHRIADAGVPPQLKKGTQPAPSTSPEDAPPFVPTKPAAAPAFSFAAPASNALAVSSGPTQVKRKPSFTEQTPVKEGRSEGADDADSAANDSVMMQSSPPLPAPAAQTGLFSPTAAGSNPFDATKANAAPKAAFSFGTQPNPSFGAPASKADPPTNFNFGVPKAVNGNAEGPTSSTGESQTPKTFVFGAKPEAVGKTPSAQPASSSGLAFTFGAPAAPASSTPFTFGTPTSSAPTTSTKPAASQPFTFGSPAPAAPSPFGSNTGGAFGSNNAGNAFGGATAQPANPSTFTFGQAASNAAASPFGAVNGASTPAFGSPPPVVNGSQAPFGSSASMFGAQQAVPSTFGSTNTSNPFGSNGQTGGTAAAFNFGQSSTQPPTPAPAAPSFAFGAPTNATPQSFAFGAGSSQSSQPQSTFNFGAPAAQAQNPFGAPAITPTAPTPGTPSGAPIMFNIGSGGGTSSSSRPMKPLRRAGR
ncbi:uncharacterized protein L969DRAFT_92819 [Mixia osmundae IAM 14324]|uniref:Uncharacterized protein n=1 Tax=Mixia osmundae (strain CBS 9802 / IAM 14324 / JCM 22182 / KY 12970) TaxID=764103 RepID=G7DYN4_MIXOS|nr:uncharacterized protein L969DRAFT_92819 [Mixia osmundae IAM 14324]KEI41593.1 hypothetical protein L969DRAFT_92819 [Mixia osmundae IAM 14324]GAA95694.1 hypothetical protein E5Q_02351 [Mixia osmundae IAM 14324]